VPKLSSELKGALIGGAVVSTGLLGGVILVGTVGNFQALRLIEVTLPTARFLVGSAIGAGVTVLALMLTKNGSGCEEREGRGRPPVALVSR
jgi:hypothetical protein